MKSFQKISLADKKQIGIHNNKKIKMQTRTKRKNNQIFHKKKILNRKIFDKT
jgi:hypothetical protein